MDKVECIVIGAGVVGLAIAAELARHGREVVVLEQHEIVGGETSSRNSEVIHAGIYYPSGSKKAELCVRGRARLYHHCEHYDVPYRRCGKLIVASRPEQEAIVRDYITKARANGVADLYWVNRAELESLEPEINGVGGVVSPSTGIIDSHSYMLSLQGILEAHGGTIAFNTLVNRIRNGPAGLEVQTGDLRLACNYLINSAGLYAPDLAAQITPGPKAYFAKGHYYAYSGAAPFSRLVYPVAESGSLGVHVTLDLAGQVKFGPDARWIDSIDYEFDESRFENFVAAIRTYYPGLDKQKLHPGYTGIRPKIAAADSGFSDFILATPADHGVAGLINLLGIESPGLTASLAIADEVCAALAV